MRWLRLVLRTVVLFPLVVPVLLLAVGEPHAAALVVSDATFRIDNEGVPVYLFTDPCRDFVTLHGALDVHTEVSLAPAARTIRTVRLYVSTANVIGTGTNGAYRALGAVAASEVCPRTDSCYVGFRTEFLLAPTTRCPETTVRVTGGLVFRPDGSLADGSRPDDPICTRTDPFGVTCSGFRFTPVPHLLAAGWGGLRRADP